MLLYGAQITDLVMDKPIPGWWDTEWLQNTWGLTRLGGSEKDPVWIIGDSRQQLKTFLKEHELDYPVHELSNDASQLDIAVKKESVDGYRLDVEGPDGMAVESISAKEVVEHVLSYMGGSEMVMEGTEYVFRIRCLYKKEGA
jgi:hypothetical protein